MNAALKDSPDDVQLLLKQELILVDRTVIERHLGNRQEASSRCRRALDMAMVLIARRKNVKRPLESSLPVLRGEARELGLNDPTLAVHGIE